MLMWLLVMLLLNLLLLLTKRRRFKNSSDRIEWIDRICILILFTATRCSSGIRSNKAAAIHAPVWVNKTFTWIDCHGRLGCAVPGKVNKVLNEPGRLGGTVSGAVASVIRLLHKLLL